MGNLTAKYELALDRVEVSLGDRPAVLQHELDAEGLELVEPAVVRHCLFCVRLDNRSPSRFEL